jgi:hypothetical protein
MPLRVVKYQTTPNPNALKIILDGHITDRPRSFRSAHEGDGDDLAARFFKIDGVTSLLFSGDWFTVNKAESAAWPPIKKAVERELASMPGAGPA